MNRPSFENFSTRAFEVAAMAVADEDVAVRRDEDGGRHVERVGTVAGHAGLAERHQHLAVLIELEHLVAFSVPARILAVGPFPVGDPDVAVAVDVDPVRPDEHAGAKALDHLARRIELQDRRDGRSDAVVGAAPLEHPDAGAVPVDRDAGGGSDLPAIGHLEVVGDGFIGMLLGGGDDRDSAATAATAARRTSADVDMATLQVRAEVYGVVRLKPDTTDYGGDVDAGPTRRGARFRAAGAGTFAAGIRASRGRLR